MVCKKRALGLVMLALALVTMGCVLREVVEIVGKIRAGSNRGTVEVVEKKTTTGG